MCAKEKIERIKEIHLMACDTYTLLDSAVSDLGELLDALNGGKKLCYKHVYDCKRSFYPVLMNITKVRNELTELSKQIPVRQYKKEGEQE